MYFKVAKICGKTKSICKIVRKVKEIHARFAVTTQTAKVMGTVRDKCLIKMEKSVEGMNKNVFCLMVMCCIRKHRTLCKEFSKGTSETSDIKPLIAIKGWFHRFRNRFRLKKCEDY